VSWHPTDRLRRPSFNEDSFSNYFSGDILSAIIGTFLSKGFFGPVP
jgi:hypothetical protein